jgi:PAS domain S-box-containing protein
MEQILGRSLQEFVDPANRATAAALLTVAQNQPVKQRLVFANAEGGLVPAYISANVLNQPDGLSICVVATDLTELENSTEMIQRLCQQQEALQAANEELAATEEELRVQNEDLNASRAEAERSRAKYLDLFETAPDGYISTDAEGIIQEVNKAAVRVLGLSAAYLKGNPFSALLPLSEIKNYFQLLACLNAEDKILPRWELELHPDNGLQFWVAITAAASRNEEGSIVGLRWLIRDISESKRQESEIRKAKEELEQRVRERTEELGIRASQLRALVGKLTLTEQNERKRLAKILHDHLQQLLVAAKFQLASLGRVGTDPVKQIAQKVGELIDESIAASRSLTAELSPHVLHESGLNAAIEWLARWMADKQGFSINLELEAIAPLPDIPKIMLFESIRELLLNAIKHSNARSAVVQLGSTDEFLRVVVSDQGVGFDPNAMRPTHESSGGFGLFSIRERLELIGGQFEIESAPGKGSRFVLSVPITQSMS